MLENSPCDKCPKKGCGAYHDVCEKYQTFAEARKNYRANQFIDKMANYQPASPFLKKKMRDKGKGAR